MAGVAGSSGTEAVELQKLPSQQLFPMPTATSRVDPGGRALPRHRMMECMAMDGVVDGSCYVCNVNVLRISLGRCVAGPYR